MVGSLSLFPSHCRKQKQLKNLLSFAELQGATSGGFSGSCCQGYKKNQALLISSCRDQNRSVIDRHKSDHMSSENYIRLSTIRTCGWRDGLLRRGACAGYGKLVSSACLMKNQDVAKKQDVDDEMFISYQAMLS
ncbi:hypothetical protein Bca4012_071279 [Brassica carinata]